MIILLYLTQAYEVYFMKKYVLIFTICCVSLSLLFMACQRRTGGDGDIVYRLKWLMNSGAAGSLYANANGFFHDEGLKVSIRPGGVERDAITELEMGRAQFGVASGDQIIRAIDKNAPICILAQLFQKSPMCWMYYKKRVSINALQDLRGKTIGITFGNEDETIMKAILQKARLQISDVHLYSVRYDYTPFYTGKVDLWPIYLNSNGVIIQEKLHQANETIGFFIPHDFGIQFVGNSVITTKKFSTEQPVIVQKFCKALLKGWETALSDPTIEQTIKIINSFDPTTDARLIRKQLQSSLPLMKPEPDVPIGRINIDAWKQTEKTLLSQKIISKPVLNRSKTGIFCNY
jgi:NitT/TauT family transport system substrate-binding protein